MQLLKILPMVIWVFQKSFMNTLNIDKKTKKYEP